METILLFILLGLGSGALIAGIALAAFAGMLAAPVASVFPGMGNDVLIVSFVVVIG